MAASATSTAHTIGGPDGLRTDVRLTLAGLVPGGRYSVFWGTLSPDSEHPGCPGVERTLPLDAFHGAADAPDPNSFVVGADGAMEYRGRVDGALLDAGQVFFSVVYHVSVPQPRRVPHPRRELPKQLRRGLDAAPPRAPEVVSPARIS